MPGAPVILALDTALGACSVAVCQCDDILASEYQPMSQGHAEALMPMLDDVIRQSGLTIDEVSLLAVTLGPGTFTGVRIGLAAARGLALALDRPLIGCSTLEAIAWGAISEGAARDQAPELTVIHDARRSEVYAQRFRIDEGTFRNLTPPVLLGTADIAAYLPKGLVAVTGSGSSLAAAHCPPATEIRFLAKEIAQPDARWVAGLARHQLTVSVSGLRYPDLPRLAPIYLRAPDARLPMASGLAHRN